MSRAQGCLLGQLAGDSLGSCGRRGAHAPEPDLPTGERSLRNCHRRGHPGRMRPEDGVRTNGRPGNAVEHRSRNRGSHRAGTNAPATGVQQPPDGVGADRVSERALRTAKWTLIRVLRPELNDPPPACPPGWPDRYCGSVCSWFYSEDEEGNWQKELPPAGFPTVLTFNSPEYDDPPDGEQVLRLRLNGCHPETE